MATPGGLSTYAETPNVAIAEGVAQLVPPGHMKLNYQTHDVIVTPLVVPFEEPTQLSIPYH